MTTALVILGVLAALFLAAALATRDSQALAPAPPDAADVVVPERVGADDVRQLRFGLAARGYRMSEVDAALDRLAAELEERDRRIAALSGEDAASGNGTVEVDGITTAGLGAAGTGMDPLLPSVPAPSRDEMPGDGAGTAQPDADPASGPTSDPASDPAALAAGEAGAAAVDVPAAPHGDDAFGAGAGAASGAEPAPSAAAAAAAPDVPVGQAPVDPPARGA